MQNDSTIISLDSTILNLSQKLDSLNSEIVSISTSIQDSKIDIINSIPEETSTFINLLTQIAFLTLGAILGWGLTKLERFKIEEKTRRQRKDHYSIYEGRWAVRFKVTDEIRYFINVRFDQINNLFLIEGISIKPIGEMYQINHTPIRGQIGLDENNKNHGSGYYSHDRNTENNSPEFRFGFMRIQLEKDRVYAHHDIYTARKGSTEYEHHTPAHVWEKEETIDEKLREKFNSWFNSELDS